jgi:ribose transport system ATP-binding protein
MRGIEKRFGATVALRGVELDVLPGSVHALIGENGAGKSTLMKTLSGACSPDAGTMELGGEPFFPSNPLHARALGVCMIYQELALAPDLSVMENILLGIEPTRGPFIRWAQVRTIAQHALREVGLPDLAPEMRTGDLPVAQQQLVEIARAVAGGCRILVLDEPTSSPSSTSAMLSRRCPHSAIVSPSCVTAKPWVTGGSARCPSIASLP